MLEALAPVGYAALARHVSFRMRSTTSAISAGMRLGRRALSLAVRVRQTMCEKSCYGCATSCSKRIPCVAQRKRSIRRFLSRSAQQNFWSRAGNFPARRRQHDGLPHVKYRTTCRSLRLRCWGFSRRLPAAATPANHLGCSVLYVRYTLCDPQFPPAAHAAKTCLTLLQDPAFSPSP